MERGTKRREFTFPFECQPGIKKAQIKGLADLEFLRRANNILLIGSPGTGKTGIAIGLLREADSGPAP